MGYFEGFAVTFKKLFKGTPSGAMLTKDFPHEKREKPARFHGRHVLNRYEDGMEKCIGCELCAGVCPAKCIYVRGADNDPENPTSPGERFGFVYEILEFSFTSRADAIYTKNELVVGDDGRPRQTPHELWMPGEDENTSGWMRATSPQGSAEFIGLVAWAGELGYGVRAPELGQTAPAVAEEPDDGHDDHGGHH